MLDNDPAIGYRERMAVEVWARNPDNYIKECIEAGISLLAWDFGVLRKKGIDVDRFCALYFGAQRYRALVIGDSGAVEVDNEHTQENPVAVHPVWWYGREWRDLEVLVAMADPDKQTRIVITKAPNLKSGIGKLFLKTLSEIQEENPHVTLHLHGLYSFRALFGLDFKSGDYEARSLAARGKVVLPSGKEVSAEMAAAEPHWVNLMGMRPVDLKIPRNRCIFNLRAAMWAAEHFKEAIKFKTKGFDRIDPDNVLKHHPTNNVIMVRRKKPEEGDKFLCDMCSLQLACKYYRQGAICIVPDSESVELARFFKTRDADMVIEGLGTLMATQTRRLEKALEAEEDKGELHPEVTRIINTLFDRGVKLAKLLNPALQKPTVGVQINTTQINSGTQQGLVAGIIQQFEAAGIPRAQVTPQMLMEAMKPKEELAERAIDVASTPAEAQGA